MYLIFGIRNKDKDYYFGQEWVKMQENYENFKIFTAFSRDQDDKCYVQHVIKVRILIQLNYSKVKKKRKNVYFMLGVHKLCLQYLAFFDHLPPSVYIFYGIMVYKKSIFFTTYPPPLVNVVCERPLIETTHEH